LKILMLIVAIALIVFFVHRSNESKKAAAIAAEQGAEFLSQNKLKEGVETSPSGLQSKVLQAGTGAEKPKASSSVKVHYHGTLTDGTVFDSSVERGQAIEFKLHQVIPGWTEGLQLMVVGEKRRLFIPASLGYGNRAAGAIPPNSALIFDVELLEIN
jgi:FKBP-type peptidyl-prolyl cis-trans isomerase